MEAKHDAGVLDTLRFLYRIGQTPPYADRPRILAYLDARGLRDRLQVITPGHCMWWYPHTHGTGADAAAAAAGTANADDHSGDDSRLIADALTQASDTSLVDDGAVSAAADAAAPAAS